MTDSPAWEVLHDSHWDTTERLAIPGGWLVRSVWRKQIAVGQPHLDGSAIVFVPFRDVDHHELTQKIKARELREAQEAYGRLCASDAVNAETDNEKTETNGEVETAEAGHEPENVGQPGSDHGSRRRRSGQ